MKKRVLSLLMALAMCLSMLPTAALAEELEAGAAASQQTAAEPEQTEEPDAPESDPVVQPAPVGEEDTPVPLSLEGETAPENAAASITVGESTTYFSDVAEAVEAAKDGDTVKLLKNTDTKQNWADTIVIPEGISLTIDTNGFKIYRSVTVNGTLTLSGSGGSGVGVTVLGKLILTDSVQLLDEYGDTCVTLGSAERGGTLEMQSGTRIAKLLVVDPGDTKLTAGTFNFWIDTSAANISVLELLVEGYALYKSGKGYIDASGTKVTEKYISVTAHPSHRFTDSSPDKCSCGFTCEHDIIDGKCQKCGTQIYAAVIGDTNYRSLGDAMSALKNGTVAMGEIKLLCDVNGISGISKDSTPYVIDLNGYTISTGDYVSVSGDTSTLTLKNGKLLSGGQCGVKLYNGASLILGANMTVKGNDYAVYVNSGTNLTLSSDTVLQGGLYSGSKKLGTYLPAENTIFVSCAVDEDGVAVRPTEVTRANSLLEISGKSDYMGNLAVMEHEHTYGNDGSCVCGKAAAVLLYDDAHPAAVYQSVTEAFENLWDGCTVKVLAAQSGSADEAVTIPAGMSVTIDLNGKTLLPAVTVLGSLRLKSASENGTARSVTLGDDETTGSMTIENDNARITELNLVKYDGSKLTCGQFQTIRIGAGNTGVTMLDLLNEGDCFAVGEQPAATRGSTEYTAAKGAYLHIMQCTQHGSWQDGYCGCCGYLCPHESVTGTGCEVCHKGAAAGVSADGYVNEAYFIDISRAVKYAESLNREKATVRLYVDSENVKITSTGKWVLNMDAGSLPDSMLTVDGGRLVIRVDYNLNARLGAVTVKNGGSFTNEKSVLYNPKLYINSLTAEEGANVEMFFGTFGTITNKGGSAVELLGPGLAYVDAANGNMVDGYAAAELHNVRIVEHHHSIGSGETRCACGYTCDHSAGYLNGVCKGCGTRCPHPVGEISGNKCEACDADLLATLTVDGVTAYFSDLDYLFTSIPDGKEAAITLLQDAEMFAVNIYPNLYNGDFGRKVFGAINLTAHSRVTLDMAGYSIDVKTSVLWISDDGATGEETALVLTGEGSFLAPTGWTAIAIRQNGKLVTSDWNGRIEQLLFDGGTAVLDNGTLGTIGVNVKELQVGSFLADGLVLQRSDGSYVKRSETLRGVNRYSGDFTIVPCGHTGTPEDFTEENCPFCGAALAALVTKTQPATGKTEVTGCATLQEAIAKAQGGTVKLLKNAGDVTVSNKTFSLDLNGKNISSLTVTGSKNPLLMDTAATGGVIGTLTYTGGMLIQLPAKGYSLKNGNGWLSAEALFGTGAANVSVAATNITAELVQPPAAVTYGDNEQFAVNAAPAGTAFTYRWYAVTDSGYEKLEGATAATYAVSALDVGTHKLLCAVTAQDGATVLTDVGSVTVEKADSSMGSAVIKGYNTTYDGSAKNLVYVFDIGAVTGGTVVYSLTGKEGPYAPGIPQQTEPGEYTVWYKVQGDKNHNDTEPQSVIGTISPIKIGAVSADSLSKGYDGSAEIDPQQLVLQFYDDIYDPITLPEGSYTITRAYFTDDRGAESPDAGRKGIMYIVKFLDDHYAPARSIDDDSRTGMYGVSSLSTGTSFSIDPAPAPTAAAGTLTIVNKLKYNYSVDLEALLPELSGDCRYGSITYGKPTTDLGVGGYITWVNSKTGELTLEVHERNSIETGVFGTITVTVTTQNYEAITLTVQVSAENKIFPEVKEVAATDITYGQKLSEAILTGTVQEPAASGDAVLIEGIFRWDSPDSLLTAGEHQCAYTFIPNDLEKYTIQKGEVTVTVLQKATAGTPEFSLITEKGKTLADAGLTATGSTLNPAEGTLEWVDEAGNPLPGITTVAANRSYRWRFTPTDTNYAPLTGTVELYHVEGGEVTVRVPQTESDGAVSNPGTGAAAPQGSLACGMAVLAIAAVSAVGVKLKKRDEQ